MIHADQIEQIQKYLGIDECYYRDGALRLDIEEKTWTIWSDFIEMEHGCYSQRCDILDVPIVELMRAMDAADSALNEALK